MSVLTSEEIQTLLNTKPRVRLTRHISEKQFGWRNDPRINAWTRQNGVLSHIDMYRWRKKIAKDPTILMFGILNEKDEEVGTAGLTDICHIHGKAEFSLLIGPEFHKQGFGKAALIELLKYGFKNLRLNLIFGETFENNPAMKMFLDVGMQEEGRLRKRYFKNGSYVDSYMVSILKEEAEAQSWWL